MNLKEIKKSKLLGNLDEVAGKYGLKGSYIEINNGISGTNLFFIVCDGDIKDLTPEIIRNNLSLSSYYFPTELKIFCLDNIYEADEAKTFFEIATYLDRLSVIRDTYLHICATALPSTLPIKQVHYICDNYLDWRDFFGSAEKKNEAEWNIKNLLKNHEQDSLILRAGADSSKGILYNLFKFKVTRCPNKVSLKHLYEQSFYEFKTYSLNYSFKKDLFKELKKYPYILYSSKKIGNALKISVCDDVANDFVEVIHRMSMPSVFQTQPITLSKKCGDLYLINAPYSYIEETIKALISNNVFHCYARGTNNKDLFTFPLLIPVDKKDVVDNILSELCIQKTRDAYMRANVMDFGTFVKKRNKQIEADKEYVYQMIKSSRRK